jgi:hypothetical protein
MYIFKSFNYCFYGRMMPCTPGIWELENKTDHINTAEHPGFWSLIEWCLACVLPQSRTFQCWPVLASNDWLDDKGGVESMSLSFPDTFPQLCLSMAVWVSWMRGTTFLLSNGNYLGNESFNEMKVPRESNWKTHFPSPETKAQSPRKTFGLWFIDYPSRWALVKVVWMEELVSSMTG